MADSDDILNIFSKGSAKTDKRVEKTPAKETPVYTLQYGTESVTLPFKDGLTVAQAFKNSANGCVSLTRRDAHRDGRDSSISDVRCFNHG